jgi:hypothetical protein
MKRGLLTFFTVFFILSFSSGQEVNLSREKTILFLHKLDTLVLNYEEYSTLHDITPAMSDQDFRLIQLFADTSLIIFDDINANIRKGKEGWIVEKQKSVSHYLNDIRNNYSTLDCKLKWTDLGNASGKLYYQESNLFVPVRVEKEYKGYTNSELPAGFATRSKLKLLVQIMDTIDFNLKITNIDKTSIQSTEWQYIPPSVRQKKVETIFSIKPSYAYFYVDDPGTNSTITDSHYDGSYGVSGELLFNFILKRKKSRITGLSLGLGGGWNNAEYSQSSYSNLTNQNDGKDDYIQITEVNQLYEKWQFYSVDFPLYLNFEKWKKKNLNKGSYLRLGGKFSYFLPASYSSSGVYNQSGYYPQYNVTLYGNIPEYGFVENATLREEGSVDINQYNYSADLNFGWMRRSRGRGMVIYFGFNLTAYIQNFLSASNEGAFSDRDHYGSMLSEFKSGRLGYAGICIGFRRAPKNEVYLLPKKVQYLDKYVP